jgi:hypothetical protein
LSGKLLPKNATQVSSSFLRGCPAKTTWSRFDKKLCKTRNSTQSGFSKRNSETCNGLSVNVPLHESVSDDSANARNRWVTCIYLTDMP